MTKALIVVDMLEEFVDGRLGGEKARAIVPNVAELANRFVADGETVVFACDAHYPDDPEIALWGEHAMAKGGVKLSRHLEDALSDDAHRRLRVMTKRTYDAFDYRMKMWLDQRNVTDVYIVGVCTHICVAQCAIGAFQMGYGVTVVADAVAGFDDTDEAFWLRHIAALTGARTPFTHDILAEVVA
jgi:nicotinamidase-related amidase